MRKPRDYDAELKTLDSKARQLRERKVKQLGELVIACGADAMPIEQLAGMLLVSADERAPATKEEWEAKGAAFFQAKRKAASGSGRDAAGGQTNDGGASARGISSSWAAWSQRPG